MLLAAYRSVCGVPEDFADFHDQLFKHLSEIEQVIQMRSTQTNIPERCAVLLPLLCQLQQPVALLEVGAAAGLCLFPDKYSYRFGEQTVLAETASPCFDCAASENTPIPENLPEVVWRGGIDLNPLDLNDKDSVEWLFHLIWPEQASRTNNLENAIKVVAPEQPDIIKGDLLEELPVLVKQAPSDATVVVFHSAVLAYVHKDLRTGFQVMIDKLDVTWVANEHPSVFPDIADKLNVEAPNDKFLLSCNGSPIAFTGPHGQSITWLDQR